MSLHDPLQAPLGPGTRLDRFELLGLVARGGMAEVWLARLAGPHGVERLFAVKTMLPQLVKDHSLHKLFIDEARIASRIDHPNVTRLHELGEIQGEPYVVMDWIDGDPMSLVLDELGDSSRMPAGIACRIVADACAGLNAAHELRDPDGELLGVVHRDISPSNILVDRHGVTRIIDFGIARARDRLAERTATGVVRGKLSYMSREQAQGASVDRRSDVWAMGAVLHHMIASRHPFEGKTPLENMRKVLEGVPAAPLPESIPAPIRAVAARALEHELDARIESAAVMRQLLIDAMDASELRTSTDDVAAYLDGLLATRRTERSAFVAAALKAARDREREAGQTTEAGAQEQLEQPPAAVLGGTLEPAQARSDEHHAPSEEPSPTPLPASATPGVRRNAVLVGALVILASAAVLAVALVRDRDAGPLAPVQASSSALPSSHPPATTSLPPAASSAAPEQSSSAPLRTPAAPGSSRPASTSPPSSSWMRDYGF